MVKIDNLEKELKNGELRSIYLFYGEETFLLESCTKKIRKLFGQTIEGINYISIDETNYQQLITNIETPAFGYNKKLIMVKNTGLFKKEGKKKDTYLEEYKNRLCKYIESNIEVINKYVLLVFVEQDIEKSDLYKIIEEYGIICNFEKQKPMQIAKRIKAICNAYKVSIDDKTLMYLIEACGTNMQSLINEIRKLIEYSGENGTITIQDINNISIKQIDSVIFDLTDSLGKRDVNTAIEVLNNLEYKKEPLPKILITLYNHFKKLYIIRIAEEYNKDIAESLNLKPNQMFLINKYKSQASLFNTQELRNIMQQLIDLDSNYKIGIIDIKTGLEIIFLFLY